MDVNADGMLQRFAVPHKQAAQQNRRPLSLALSSPFLGAAGNQASVFYLRPALLENNRMNMQM